MIVYEQPLNELIRACLRLEHLFQEIDHARTNTSQHDTRQVIASILDILHVLDRPDLKTKLAKELSLFITHLLRLEHDPKVDQEKLYALIKQMEGLTRVFLESDGKIGQHLRDIELLNTLRLQLATPGSGCSFDLPMYHYWLMQPESTRSIIINQWLAEFNHIRLTTEIILRLCRESVQFQEKHAEGGSYQELLDPQSNLRLIRVRIPIDVMAYPEISVGRHYLSIRFSSPQIETRPTQYLHTLRFEIANCSG